MKQLFQLFYLDYYLVKDWFSEYKLTKFSVFLAFLGLLTLVWFGLYLGSVNFFYYLSGFEPFGQLTSHYILHTSLVTIAWLGLGTGLIAHLRWLAYSPLNAKLITYPIQPLVLVGHHSLKASIGSFLVLSYFVTPFLTSYAAIYTDAHPNMFWIRTGLVLFTVAIFSQTLSLLVLNGLKRFVISQAKIPMFTFLVLLFLFSAFLILRLILPNNLRILYASEPENFAQVYQTLPLNHPWIPTKWLLDSIVSQINFGTIGLVMLGSSLFLFSIHRLSKKFISITQRAYLLHQTPHQVSSQNQFKHFPLVNIWWLNFVRNHSEVGYAGFMLLLSTVFFGILSQAQNLRDLESIYYKELFLFVLSWSLLGATAFSLRFAFPLISQLKLFSWQLIALPISRTKLWISVLVTGFVICLPMIMIHTLAWTLIPLPGEFIVLGIGLSLWSMLVIVISNTILGAVSPYFDESNNLELSTMTGMGLVALVWSLIVMILSGILAWQYLSGKNDIATVLTYLGLLSLIPLLVFSPLSRYRVKNLEL